MFKVGDVVNTTAAVANQRQGGKVKYIACANARGSVGTCDKKTCPHPPTHVWVLWPGMKSTVSYPEEELELVQVKVAEEEIGEDIALEAKSVIKEKFANIEKSSSEYPPEFWAKYNGFDKRWASKKDYPDKPPLPDSALDAEFWKRYNYGNANPDRRTLR
jgi:hypothetical protein